MSHSSRTIDSMLHLWYAAHFGTILTLFHFCRIVYRLQTDTIICISTTKRNKVPLYHISFVNVLTVLLIALCTLDATLKLNKFSKKNTHGNACFSLMQNVTAIEMHIITLLIFTFSLRISHQFGVIDWIWRKCKVWMRNNRIWLHLRYQPWTFN